MSGLSAAVERCALGIRGRPAALSSPAASSLRRAAAPRRPSALTASRRGPVEPRAVATTPADRVSPDLVGRFTLESNSELQVTANPAPQGSQVEVDLVATNTSGSLNLHWGALCPERSCYRDWLLPSRRPDGTTVYKDRALRTPFVKSGDNSSLRIEVDDPAVQALEFLVFDEGQNKWFKNNGQNFLIQLQTSHHQGQGPSASSSSSVTSVPEDLVQIQAYLRWERNGNQSHTPEQEKEEYEAARAELIDELNQGVSLEKLRAKLTKAPGSSNSDSPAPQRAEDELHLDLVQVQAYIQWEKVGKPNYSPEKQQLEFEEARKALQAELDNGISIDQLRKKILKGNIESKVSKQLKNKKYFSVERIQRKKRDIMQLLNKHKSDVTEQKVETTPIQPTVLDLFNQSLQEKDGCEVLSRKLFKFGDNEILAIATKDQNKTKVYLAMNHMEPLILHWSLAKKA